MARDPTTDRTTIASWSEELLDTTVDRVSMRERLLRMRRMAPRVAMVSVAAATAYLIARYAVGHPRPFFAPIATVVVLGITLGQRTRRALQLAVGVALGVLIADLVVQVIGTGAWQIAVIVFLGMMVVVFLGGDQMVVVQAANAGVLIAVLAIPGDPTGLSRFIDALIGASTALVFNLVLFPVNPLKLAAGALEPAVNRLGAVIDAVADALESEDDDAAAEALRRARLLDVHLADMRAAIETSGETARLALVRRGQRDAVARYTRALNQVTRAQRDVAGLARGAQRAVLRGDRVPPSVIAGLRELAEAARHLSTAFADPDERDKVQEAALHAAAATTAGLDETRNLSVSLVVGQARMTAHDILRASGLSLDEARADIRAVADTDDERRARMTADAMADAGLDGEIEAPPPPADPPADRPA
ncbi:MAG TPA: FUSC family protein [Solirubrobacteraceae bacterium]|nr:FUSC family protein [Solirubrobacteraceae bacterium]